MIKSVKFNRHIIEALSQLQSKDRSQILDAVLCNAFDLEFLDLSPHNQAISELIILLVEVEG